MEARAAVSMGCSSGLLESFLESAQPHRLNSIPKRHTTRRLIQTAKLEAEPASCGYECHYGPRRCQPPGLK